MNKLKLIIIATWFIPWIMLAWIISKIRIVFELTFVFAWELSSDFVADDIKKVNDTVQEIKSKSKDLKH